MKKPIAIMCLIAGILCILLSFGVYGSDTGSYESNKSYGGDAYTGIQNASAQAANNVQYLTEAVAFGGGSVMLISGLVLVLFAVNGMTSGGAKKPFPAPVNAPQFPYGTPANPYNPNPAPTYQPTPPAQPYAGANPVPPAPNAVRIDRSNLTVICPKCGASQASSRETCYSCGVKFESL